VAAGNVVLTLTVCLSIILRSLSGTAIELVQRLHPHVQSIPLSLNTGLAFCKVFQSFLTVHHITESDCIEVSTMRDPS